MKLVRLILIGAMVLIWSIPAVAQRSTGKYGCFRCEVVYSTTSYYKEKCVQVSSGQYGDGIFCYILPMDGADFCQMSGGGCYYIVVEGAAKRGNDAPAKRPDADAPRAVHVF